MNYKKYISDEVIHRNKEGVLVSNKVVRIDLNKAIVIFATAVIGSAGSAFWAGLRIANAVPFQIQAIENEIKSMKEDRAKLMPLDLSIEKWKVSDQNFSDIKNRLNTIEGKIDSIRNLIK